jgi:hypothetical protein
MIDTFSRFNVEITDVDPGPNVDHFEVMVGGTPGQIGLPSGVGGIAEYPCQAPGSCQKYIPNTIAYAFAGVYGDDPIEICATAAQEIAHTFTLDHVDDASDPMTYNPFSGMRQFKDGVPCGSDCFGGQNAFGLPCSGANGQRHVCMSSGIATQDDVRVLTELFGPAGAKAPTLKLKNPVNNTTTPPSFSIEVECTASDPIQEVDLQIDGRMLGTLTAPPYTFMANALTMGPHRVSVLCATDMQAIATAAANITVGTACTDDTMCDPGYLCFNSACIAGPEADGGIGAACEGNEDCVSGLCASDGDTSSCTMGCNFTSGSCPAGFGCLDSGGGNGVCWAGLDDGGCCDTGGGNPGAILFGLGIFGLLIVRRNRR